MSATHDRITNLVNSAGGEILARNDWGRRRLAYPIRKLNDAFYVTLIVNLPPQSLRGLERALQLTEPVLRYMIVRAEPKITPPPAAPATAAAATPAAPEAPAPSELSAAPAAVEGR